jgi:hypothetical protein
MRMLFVIVIVCAYLLSSDCCNGSVDGSVIWWPFSREFWHGAVALSNFRDSQTYIGASASRGDYLNDEDLFLCNHVANDTTDNEKG